MKITILGAGLVGLPMAADLHAEENFSVVLCDKNEDRLKIANEKYGIKTITADLSDENTIKNIIADADIVLSAVPGFMGFKTLRTIIDAGKNVIDIAFFPEDLFELDELAKQKGVIAISDIGVAPGMSHILSTYSMKQLDSTSSIKIYVGGLPKIRKWPFEYKAPFSPADVIEEYTRPARFIRDGKEISMPALSEPELMDFAGIGTLEAFNSDGLRSLMKTVKCPSMIEKTLRYPGHIEKIRLLRDIGFFRSEMMTIGDQKIRPIDFTSRLLFPLWDLKDDEDITVMKIIVEGKSGGNIRRITWDLFDRFDKESGIHSMARTTGYTATAAVRMLASGLYKTTGVSAPEFIGRSEECTTFILDQLQQRGIVYNKQVEDI
jgi:lysine 6-dehydrogenase